MTVCLGALRDRMWIVNESHICRFLECMLFVSYGGDERVNSVMGLCAGFGAKLVGGESVVNLSVYCQSD